MRVTMTVHEKQPGGFLPDGTANDGRTPQKPFRLSHADIRKVRLAREILLRDIQSPPTLSALAALTGLNGFKLKAGFRAVFSNSVFGYLSEYRLQLARCDVLQGNKSITAIAYDMGYTSLSHFSNAFRKKFGTSPLKMKVMNATGCGTSGRKLSSSAAAFQNPHAPVRTWLYSLPPIQNCL